MPGHSWRFVYFLGRSFAEEEKGDAGVKKRGVLKGFRRGFFSKKDFFSFLREKKGAHPTQGGGKRSLRKSSMESPFSLGKRRRLERNSVQIAGGIALFRAERGYLSL